VEPGLSSAVLKTTAIAWPTHGSRLLNYLFGVNRQLTDIFENRFQNIF
jgi:hypothetical protein